MSHQINSLELAIIVVWVHLPPLAMAALALNAWWRRRPGIGMARKVWASMMLVLLSLGLSMAFIVLAPAGWGSSLGLRDKPFMWAPFAFVAVGLALVPSLWLMQAGRRQNSATRS